MFRFLQIDPNCEILFQDARSIILHQDHRSHESPEEEKSSQDILLRQHLTGCMASICKSSPPQNKQKRNQPFKDRKAARPLGEFLCVSGSQQKTWRLLVKNNRQGRSWRLLPFQAELINQLLKVSFLSKHFAATRRFSCQRGGLSDIQLPLIFAEGDVL